MKLSSMKNSAWMLAIAAIIIVGVWYFLGRSSSGTRIVTAAVTEGPIVRSVTATGTVNPVITVQLGTYVSGPIIAIYKDYNAPVTKGQLIAKIDPSTYQVTVDVARATLANSLAQLGKDNADLDYKKVTYDRNLALYKADAVSKDTLDSAYSAWQMDVAQIKLDHANIQQQTANVKAAEVNLNYTNIVSPVDGTVVSRNVDVGQTVAASFQTPTLFLIAKDLTKMQVDSNVSESDIGYVRQGQKATFRVDAFPDRDFEGVVSQVRQAPITVQNVVTYDVVVSVENPELLLKPGMTANVNVVTASKAKVVRVPIDALRFAPPGEPPADSAALDGAPGRQTRVWVLENRKVTPVTITTGLSDGTWVEVAEGNVQAGDRVVTDEVRGAGSHGAGSSSSHGGGGGGIGGMMHMPH
ncbi:efflux RND transporter periplasmic adaptor subunit [Candidatus Binatus soli]|jgi:HlyD family secretion protein|uniref:efflux RND transporter periplasmic adaptor subunit n=1 Tax=Candidatus Binatus soli TaxID=1953413 RepID=UPI003D0FF679